MSSPPTTPQTTHRPKKREPYDISPWTLTTTTQGGYIFDVTPTTILASRQHSCVLIKLSNNLVVFFYDRSVSSELHTQTRYLAARLGLTIVAELICTRLAVLAKHHSAIPLINALILSGPEPSDIHHILHKLGPNDPTFLPLATAVAPLVKAAELQNLQVFIHSPPGTPLDDEAKTTHDLIRYLVNHGVAYQPEPETIPQLL